MTRTLVATLALALLAGCGDPPELPPARPLTASASELGLIPHIDPGPHRAVASKAVDWAVDGRELRVRAVWPDASGPFPLVVFSHGFASDIDQYDAVLAHWASHGHVSIAPMHRDGGGTLRGIFSAIVNSRAALIAARVNDVRAVLDNIDALDAIAPGLSARIDRERIAVAGHSFGAFTAQQFAGASVTEPETGATIGARDGRVRGVIALSPPGEMFGLIREESWRTMDAPMLATTGTWDVDGRFVTDWRQHRLSFETALPGHNWLLVVEGADHYLGNLICRTDREAPPQHDALRLVNATTTSFLDALFEPRRPFPQDPLARLAEITDGFAVLEHR